MRQGLATYALTLANLNFPHPTVFEKNAYDLQTHAWLRSLLCQVGNKKKKIITHYRFFKIGKESCFQRYKMNGFILNICNCHHFCFYGCFRLKDLLDWWLSAGTACASLPKYLAALGAREGWALSPWADREPAEEPGKNEIGK